MNNIGSVWVVWMHLHEDDYKRAYSDSEPIGCYMDRYEAYKEAMKHNITYIRRDCEKPYETYLEQLLAIDNVENQYEYMINHFEELYGEPNYTMKPWHQLWRVKELKVVS